MSTNFANLFNDPIAAIATPVGTGAIAIIRLSGSSCHQLLIPFLYTHQRDKNGLIQKKFDSRIDEIPDRFMMFIGIRDPLTLELLDDGLAVFFKGMRSFTGENSAELHIHGGPFNVQKIMATLLRHGFRLAEPGEFSKRAYLNGKIDLTTAEGIRSLVEANTHQEWVAARQLASGTLKKHIEELRTSLIEGIAILEAQVDFPEEDDTSHLTIEAVDHHIHTINSKINKLLSSFQSGFVASHGLKVVLIGEPNAGKSTLMNTLLNKERSLVTEIPGTTRDYLEEKCLVNGRLIRLFDLAGIRESIDPVESLGIKKAKEIASMSDFALILIPCDQPIDLEKYQAWIREFKIKNFLFVLTKSDLPLSAPPEIDSIRISCHLGVGIEALKEAIASQVDLNVAHLSDTDPFITDIRHFDGLENARIALSNYFTARNCRESVEILGAELRYAAQSLASIIGEIGADDILDQIFGQFCIGK